MTGFEAHTQLLNLFNAAAEYLKILYREPERELTSTKILPAAEQVSPDELRILLALLIEKEGPVHWRYSIQGAGSVSDTAGMTIHSFDTELPLFELWFIASERGFKDFMNNYRSNKKMSAQTVAVIAENSDNLQYLSRIIGNDSPRRTAPDSLPDNFALILIYPRKGEMEYYRCP